MKAYAAFLEEKGHIILPAGREDEVFDINPMLFPFQREIVDWALRRGRCAVFADCGLGKTFIQLEWAKFHEQVLIVAPLAVSAQTIREAKRIGLEVNACRSQEDVKPGINITNYEVVHKFKPGPFDAIVLDESSILKSYSGKYRQELTRFASKIAFRLCCTATPAPNDLIEITNHAEFLGMMTGKEVIALYFTQDGNTSHDYRLKGHAVKDFWRWMASWSVALRKPSDLGYPDDGFILPPLQVHEHIVANGKAADGQLIPVEAQTLDERRQARKVSTDERVALCCEVVSEKPDEPWLIWCNLNDESVKAARAIDATEVTGSMDIDAKEAAMTAFSTGDISRLVSKPRIAGHGMNWQHCSNVVFLGLSDSWEEYYQAVRRCWRFGQVNPVNVHIIISEAEGAVRQNIERKEREAAKLFDGIIENMGGLQLHSSKPIPWVQKEHIKTEDYELFLGDCVEQIKNVADESVGLSVFSPPFPGMYVYTDSVADMGNSKDFRELIDHFKFLIPDLLRITQPGRSCCIHLTQGVAFKWVDGYIGLKDFRGEIISAMSEAGWVYYGEVTIDKDPQVKAIRTKDRGLLFKTLAKDASNLHMALADYLLQFKKPGESPEPIRAGISEKYDNPDGWITPDEWIEWAAPVWYRQTPDYPGGIRETDVLNVRQARETNDERHLCPLQLGVIERAVKLWSNPGDIVFSPFAGIGSEGYEAIKHGRRFIGIELKKSYFNSANTNLKEAVREVKAGRLF